MYIKSLILLVLIISVSCGNSLIESVTGAPDRPKLKNITAWPDSLVVETFYYGGMSPESDRVSIRKDSCIVESGWGQNKNRYAFVPDQKDLNALLVQLNDYNIDKLHEEKTKGVIYDAPTSGISIRLGNKFISISNGATEEVAEKNEGDFRNCINLLNTFSAKGVESFRRKICITIDNSIKKSKGEVLSIIPEKGANSYWDTISQLKDKVCFDFLQGKYNLQIHITRRGKVSYTEYVASIYPELEVKDNLDLTLTLKNDSTLELK